MVSTFRIGIVPEHFSVPLFMGQEAGIFTKHGIHVELIEYHKGTGLTSCNIMQFFFCNSNLVFL